jgi:hypothetical protein
MRWAKREIGTAPLLPHRPEETHMPSGADEKDRIRIPASRLCAHVQHAVHRIEAEYREMPGLVLTVSQAKRLLGLDLATCEVALAALRQRRFLKRSANGAYLREQPG